MRRKEPGDCYHTRALDKLPEHGGRFAALSETVNIGETNRYPEVAETPLTTQQPDHAFAPDRDRVDEPTSMNFGVDITRLPGSPPPASDLVSPEATGGAVTPSAPPLFHPNVVKVGEVFAAFVGKGMEREFLGDWATFDLALEAVRKAEADRG